MAPIYVGGCLRRMVERKSAEAAGDQSDPGILAASGLVAGEGLAGVRVAVLVAAGIAPRSMDPRVAGLTGEIVALVVVLAVSGFLIRAGRSTARQG